MNLPGFAMDPASFPQMYERWLVGPLFRPWAELTVEELGLSAGDAVLDVACGTGIAARVAQQRLGDGSRIVGVDASPGMLAVARAVAPQIDWREGSADALPLGDGQPFDVVICQQGLQFFPDKPAAAAQMRRALAPGGRLAVSTWRSDDETPLPRELRRVAERHLGPIADQRYGYGDAGRLEQLLRDAGFAGVRVRERSRTVRLDGQIFVRMNAMALIGMSAGGKTMSPDERQRVLQTIVHDSAPALSAGVDGHLAVETRSNLATARG
ncbi:MAG TPA: methyltransferase domain-containing protein [Burkholderiaceae bacterium]|nr:methyltransferase domain-containing protein [Burkholderiaceae bacterium]